MFLVIAIRRLPQVILFVLSFGVLHFSITFHFKNILSQCACWLLFFVCLFVCLLVFSPFLAFLGRVVPLNRMDKDECTSDVKVGSIVIYALEKEKEVQGDTEPTDYFEYFFPKPVAYVITDPTESERRYVYSSRLCQDRPYYLTHTGNRVFVVDTSRIDYFPVPGVVPVELQDVIKDYQFDNRLVEDEEKEEEEEEEEVEQPQKAGIIIIQVPEMNDNRKWIFKKEKRDVMYMESEKVDGKPLYFYLTGAKRTYVDQRNIRYLRPDGTEPQEEEEEE